MSTLEQREPESAPPETASSALPEQLRPAHTRIMILAFAALYISWGTTFLAIRTGVHEEHWPPALFAGTRILLAGIILLGFLHWRGVPTRLPRADLFWTTIGALLLFVGGNWLLTLALDWLPSGVCSVMATTMPLILALMESMTPRGERLALRGWLGLVLGLAGVILLSPHIHSIADVEANPGPLLVLCSATLWALGSLAIRHHPPSVPAMSAAAHQMLIGGVALTLIGLVQGEAGTLRAEHFSARSWFAFGYLLIVGSLIGFLAYRWLIGNVSPSLVGTYAYVNPMVAVLVGWMLAGEDLTPRILAGMGVILTGVALVRSARRRRGEAGPSVVRTPV